MVPGEAVVSQTHPAAKRPDVAVFVPSLRGGGAEWVMVQLANALQKRGARVDLVPGSATGAYLDRVDEGVRLVDLGQARVSRAVLPLARYLRRARPKALLATMNHANVAAVLATTLARTRNQLVLREANCVGGQLDDARSWRTHAAIRSIRFAYRRANRVVGVSRDVAADLVEVLGVSESSVEVIYNPVDFPLLEEQAAHPLAPVVGMTGSERLIVSVGRLAEHKDHLTLLRAMPTVLAAHPDVHLLIMGEGEMRPALEAEISRLGLESHVSLPGFLDNPFPFVARAEVMAHPSRREGLPNSLIQSIALGTPVVAVDGPGVAEALEGSGLGTLVGVGDAEGLGRAISGVLSAPASADRVVPTAWRDRFALDGIVDRYAEALGL